MKLQAILTLGLLGLSACGVQNSLGGSAGSLNSANSSASAGSSGNSSGGSLGGSFGSVGGQSDEPEIISASEYKDPRAFVNVIKSIQSDKTRGGTILRVVGAVPGQGYHNVDLVFVESENPREMLFEFRAAAPAIPQAAPTVRSRELHVAVFVSELDEPQARVLRVRALDNSRTVRR